MRSPTFRLLLSSLLALGSCGHPREAHFQGPSPQDRGSGHDGHTSLYRAPAPYRSLGKPLLNSFIVTSRPLDLNKNVERRKGPSPSPAPEDGFHYLPQFEIDCDAGRGPCSETITSPPPSPPTTPPTFKQHSQESILRFVQRLRHDGNGIRRAGEDHDEGSEGAPEDQMDGGQHSIKLSKANLWYRPSPHRPPHNDKKGWVALDPVPWSSSKISKWAPDKNNPGSKPPEATRAPPFLQSKPAPAETPYHRPPAPHPAVQGSHSWHSSPRPPRPHDSYQSASSASSPIIITDGKDPEWPLTHSGPQRPAYGLPSNVRPQTHLQVRPESSFPFPDHRPPVGHRPHGWGSTGQQLDGSSRRPQNYPTPVVYHDEPPSSSHNPHSVAGGGQWVVLSDTKEYKPKTASRRSYGRRLAGNEDAPPKVRTSRRMVKLMVLPSEGNFTTSHGGMLEVDGSFDTVDEDRRKRLLLGGGAEQANDATPVAVAWNLGRVATRIDRAKAVMAAVGAGMVPATVAAVLPLALAGRRGRRSDLLGPPSPAEEGIHRYGERPPMHVKAF